MSDNYLDGLLIKKLADAFDVIINLTNEEKELLISHFNNEDLNQFYLLIVQKVLKQKSFTVDNHDVITGLLSVLTAMDLEKMQIENNDDIINVAEILYKVLMMIDIQEFYNNKF